MSAMMFGSVSAGSPGLLRRLLAILVFGVLAGVAAPDCARAASKLNQGLAAIERQDYGAAAALLGPIAQAGNPAAQAHLGYLYEIGRGVPQDFTQAALWYRRAAEQGESFAQFQLGMLYDKGHGVPVDVVEAQKWLILATAAAPPIVVEDRQRIRDAVRTKMTRGEIAEARMRALAWQPRREQ
jgi:TPR repeat protein